MPSLIDIAAARERVAIGSIEVECRGLGLNAIAYVFAESPELRRLLTSGQAPADAWALLERVPDAAYRMLAAGTGKLGDPDEERAAAGLVFEDQVNLLGVILKLTFPGGLIPFFGKLLEWGRAAGIVMQPPLPNGEDEAGRDSFTNSPPAPTS